MKDRCLDVAGEVRECDRLVPLERFEFFVDRFEELLSNAVDLKPGITCVGAILLRDKSRIFSMLRSEVGFSTVAQSMTSSSQSWGQSPFLRDHRLLRARGRSGSPREGGKASHKSRTQ